jgi:hypothetical protein
MREPRLAQEDPVDLEDRVARDRTLGEFADRPPHGRDVAEHLLGGHV